MSRFGLQHSLCVATMFAVAMAATTAFAQSSGQNKSRAKDFSSPAARTLAESLARSLAGNDETWYFVSLQDTSALSKSRARTVVRGKAAAASLIAQFVGTSRSRKYWVEVCPTQQSAEARMAWWQDYDRRSGYRTPQVMRIQ